MDYEVLIAEWNRLYSGKLARLRQDSRGDIQVPHIIGKFDELHRGTRGTRLTFHFTGRRFANYIGEGWTLELHDGTVLSWPR